jgi:hypothetical protein
VPPFVPATASRTIPYTAIGASRETGVGALVVIYFAMGERSRHLLDELRPGCPATTGGALTG